LIERREDVIESKDFLTDAQVYIAKACLEKLLAREAADDAEYDGIEEVISESELKAVKAEFQVIKAETEGAKLQSDLQGSVLAEMKAADEASKESQEERHPNGS